MTGGSGEGLGRLRRFFAASLLLAPAALAGCGSPPIRLAEPVNLVLVVVDTLRADHLPFHGYERDTAPNLDRLFADEGIVFEAAYSQASWTPPSMASLLTGRVPVRFASADLRRWRIPPADLTLAERLAAVGYRTGGFQANLLLAHDFKRGFDHYFMTGHDSQTYLMTADQVLSPALEWLGENSADVRPFFLYVHFIDPHDPYFPPRPPGARPLFDPDYRGRLTGEEIHGLNHGVVSLSEDRERDIHHLTALYDEEIRVVDRAIGELVAAVEARAAKRPTLFVVTSDHGEEIQGHGGWTHGRTIYQEIVHVPLVFRLAGAVEGGRRVATAVQLLDVAPTLLAAAQAPKVELDGRDLLPVLLDPRIQPESQPIHLRSWQRGPLRIGLVEGRSKTMLYNKGEPFRPTASLEAHLASEDDRRLPRAVSFDLARDPDELEPLPPDPGQVDSILAQVLPTFEGVRVLLRDAQAGAMVSGRIRWGKTPRSVVPLLLGEWDRVERQGRWIEFRFRAERHSKGFLVQGRGLSLERLELDVAEGDEATRVEIGRGGSRIPARRRELMRADFPTWSGNRSLRIWEVRGSARESATMPALDDDTVHRLKALGYL